jgi:hypothetical protein
MPFCATLHKLLLTKPIAGRCVACPIYTVDYRTLLERLQ